MLRLAPLAHDLRRAGLVLAHQARVAHHVSGEDRREFPGLAHCAPRLVAKYHNFRSRTAKIWTVGPILSGIWLAAFSRRLASASKPPDEALVTSAISFLFDRPTEVGRFGAPERAVNPDPR